MSPSDRVLQGPALSRHGVPHGFAAPGTPVPLPYWRAKQVHGRAVVDVRPPGADRVEADGVLSRTPGLAAAVVTADCVPVLVATDDGAAVAALHAGWRGLAAGIVEAGLSRLREERPGSRLVVALGPAAGACCYEVGPEVLEALRPAASRIVPTRAGHARLDLRGAVLDRLVAAGVDEADIDVVGPCSICDVSWPSYRREGAAAGRILSYVAPRG